MNAGADSPPRQTKKPSANRGFQSVRDTGIELEASRAFDARYSGFGQCFLGISCISRLPRIDRNRQERLFKGPRRAHVPPAFLPARIVHE